MPPITSSTITESQILSNYLLPPASLHTILPYTSPTTTTSSSNTPATFLSLLPSSARSNPTTRQFYADLQFQRNITIDTVRENIERECTRALGVKARLRRQIVSEFDSVKGRKRKRGHEDGSERTLEREEVADVSSNQSKEEQEAERDVTFDSEFHSSSYLGNLPPSTSTTNHTFSSLLRSMSSAVRDLETEMSELDAESEKVLAELDEVVGGLSDLRYGRFANRISGDGNGDESQGIEASVVEGLKELKKVIERKSRNGEVSEIAEG